MEITKSVKRKLNREVDVPQEGIADVRRFGKNGAHVIVSSQWIGQKVRVTLLK